MTDEALWSKLARHAALLAMLLFVLAGLAYSTRLLSGRSYFWIVGLTLSAYAVGLIAAEGND